MWTEKPLLVENMWLARSVYIYMYIYIFFCSLHHFNSRTRPCYLILIGISLTYVTSSPTWTYIRKRQKVREGEEERVEGRREKGVRWSTKGKKRNLDCCVLLYKFNRCFFTLPSFVTNYMSTIASCASFLC